MTLPEHVVFDAEPLVAYADDEPGSDAVAEYLDAVISGEVDGSLHFVTATEVRYILARKYDRETADEFLDWVWTIGVDGVDAAAVWDTAAEFILDCNPALGDAYALATAETVGGTVLVGGDDDYDEVSSVPLVRFRDHGV
jgi:predicted nucleic acid-binding protein